MAYTAVVWPGSEHGNAFASASTSRRESVERWPPPGLTVTTCVAATFVHANAFLYAYVARLVVQDEEDAGVEEERTSAITMLDTVHAAAVIEGVRAMFAGERDLHAITAACGDADATSTCLLEAILYETMNLASKTAPHSRGSNISSDNSDGDGSGSRDGDHRVGAFGGGTSADGTSGDSESTLVYTKMQLPAAVAGSVSPPAPTSTVLATATAATAAVSSAKPATGPPQPTVSAPSTTPIINAIHGLHIEAREEAATPHSNHQQQHEEYEQQHYPCASNGNDESIAHSIHKQNINERPRSPAAFDASDAANAAAANRSNKLSSNRASSSSSEDHSEGRLGRGDKVVVCGLSDARSQHLNNTPGRVAMYDVEKERYGM